MKLLQIDFATTGPFGAEMSAAMADLARLIASEPGLIWKVWTENAATGEAGGIYLFRDAAAAEAYVVKHTARLEAFGIVDARIKLFDVNEPLSRINRAPL